MKRYLALLLCLVLLIGSFPSNVSYGATYNITESEYAGFSSSKITDTERGALQKIKNLGIPLNDGATKNRMFVCIKVLTEYELVVYNYADQHLTSTGFGDHSNNMEWRYLGYNLNHVQVTNDLRYNDTGKEWVDANSLKSKNWVKSDEKTKSWFMRSPEVKKIILDDEFVSDDGTKTPNEQGVTLRKVLSNKASTDEALLPYIQLQSEPTLAN